MLRFLTAGESHGPSLTLILEGFPAGMPLDIQDLAADLGRRQTGAGSGDRMKIEDDGARITGGVLAGHTTGAPVAITIPNKDFISWEKKVIDPMSIPRPGHADLAAALKYGYPDLRLGLERSSARETAARVAIGAICRKLLLRYGISIGSYISQIASVRANFTGKTLEERIRQAEESAARCPDPEATRKILQAIDIAANAGDTLGGVIELAALNVPPGLGSHVHWDRRLSSRLAQALMSIPAIKAMEIGEGAGFVSGSGSTSHDGIKLQDGRLERTSNHAGGLEGGISNGEPILVRLVMKPIATTRIGSPSVNLISGESAVSRYERSDVCPGPRAAVVGEAMMAIVLAGALLEKLGGDTVSEMDQRWFQMRTGRLENMEVRDEPTVFWP
ncbi:MAG: chorismate synthase [Anaerolineales bacterium]|nr:chorismate synthase [Anaerolineales bacterium]